MSRKEGKKETTRKAEALRYWEEDKAHLLSQAEDFGTG